jgi:hypothetical protein
MSQGVTSSSHRYGSQRAGMPRISKQGLSRACTRNQVIVMVAHQTRRFGYSTKSQVKCKHALVATHVHHICDSLAIVGGFSNDTGNDLQDFVHAGQCGTAIRAALAVVPAVSLGLAQHVLLFFFALFGLAVWSSVVQEWVGNAR